jgi:hypothetical protein
VTVTQPANAAAYLYSKELKGGATDCIMSSAGYKSSGKPGKIILKAETPHLANNNITKITAFICDEGNMRVLNTPREVTFQIADGDMGKLIGNHVTQSSGGTAVIYYQAGTTDDVVRINAFASGCKTGSVRITCDEYGQETGYKPDQLPSDIHDPVGSKFNIYPNPLTVDSYIKCDLPEEGTYALKLTGMEGNTQYCSSGLYLTRGENIIPLNIPGLKPGMYILCLYSDTVRFMHKVMIY